jgi:hypothetical protein
MSAWVMVFRNVKLLDKRATDEPFEPTIVATEFSMRRLGGNHVGIGAHP